MSGAFLEFNVTKRFPGFNLECRGAFESGITAIFGPSGSGKTTLLNCIAGLTRPDSGEIVVDAEVLYSSSSRKSVPPERRRIGYVFQESALFPNMTVGDNVLYGYKLTPQTRRKTDPAQLIELLDLDSLMGRSVANLSGGERQRVALARALASSPSLLLLDEPLSSLDVGFRGVIIEYLKRVRREIGTPMVYVSHSLSEVMALAEMAFVLHRGNGLAYGRPSQVLVDPAMTALADYSTLENLLEARVVTQADGGLAELQVGTSRWLVRDVHKQPDETVVISIRAGDVIVALDVPPKISARNVIEAVIDDLHVLDDRVLVYADIGERIVVEITAAALQDLGLQKGQEVYLIIKTNSVLVLDRPEPSPG
jgi:molybdate transport system ATP-binding protein